jgi:teichuronic acid biosynthesis glycosyltransferase TuaG
MQFNQPLVSIITPCYNAASVLSATIDSVRAQTYGEWEMIIVDDCSTDSSAAVVEKYRRMDSRIRYLKTDCPSGSPSVPRNLALDAARGKYVAFLDSDDLWLPEKLEEQIVFLESGGYEFVYSDYEKITYEGRRSGRVLHMRQSASYWDMLETSSVPCLTALLTREAIGAIRFRPVPKEDYAFWLDVLRMRGIVAYNTGRVHALYREARNTRSSNKLKMFRQQWHVLRSVEGVKKVPAVYFLFTYAVRGLLKFLK